MGSFSSRRLFDWLLVALGIAGIVLFGPDVLFGLASSEFAYSSPKHGLRFFGQQALVVLGSLCALSILLLAMGAVGLWRKRFRRTSPFDRADP